MIEAKSLKVGSMWSKRYSTHVHTLQCLPIISLSQRIPHILVLGEFSFSWVINLIFFLISSYTFPFFVCSFHDQDGSVHLLTGLSPNANQHTYWDHLFHSSSIFINTKVSLKYNLNISHCNLRPCIEKIVQILFAVFFYRHWDLSHLSSVFLSVKWPQFPHSQ